MPRSTTSRPLSAAAQRRHAALALLTTLAGACDGAAAARVVEIVRAAGLTAEDFAALDTTPYVFDPDAGRWHPALRAARNTPFYWAQLDAAFATR